MAGIFRGRWEGDEFVVESIGFRDRGWLSANMAYPNSDALNVIERWRRRLRSPAGDRHHRRSEGVPETVDEQDYPELQADTEILDSYCDNQVIMQAHYSMGPPPASRQVLHWKVGAIRKCKVQSKGKRRPAPTFNLLSTLHFEL